MPLTPPATILLTGITGFIAKRIAIEALNRGYAVRGSLRSPGRAAEVRAAVAAHVADEAALERLSFTELDLMSDVGWDGALEGVDALIHTASPFPLSAPKTEDDLIRPAVEGTRRALGAAVRAGVERVVLTSSVAAVESTDIPPGAAYTEANWTEPDHRRATAYIRSKTLAERAAWEIAEANPGLKLTAINPPLVAGTPADGHYGTSLRIVESILTGGFPMLPRFGIGLVDVADVAEAHVTALERDASIGRRFIVSSGSMWMAEIAGHLAARYPERKISLRVAPDLMVKAVALFDRAAAQIGPSLGHKPVLDSSAAREVLGIGFVPMETALDRAAEAVIAKTG